MLSEWLGALAIRQPPRAEHRLTGALDTEPMGYSERRYMTACKHAAATIMAKSPVGSPRKTYNPATTDRNVSDADSADTQILPLQLRLPRQVIREIKIAAVEADLTISELMHRAWRAYQSPPK